MIDLAYSTDCCHVINATSDEQLGRFYAENDFIPALEKFRIPSLSILTLRCSEEKPDLKKAAFSQAAVMSRSTPS